MIGTRFTLFLMVCAGLITDKIAPWAKKWDHIIPSNLIQHENRSAARIAWPLASKNT